MGRARTQTRGCLLAAPRWSVARAVAAVLAVSVGLATVGCAGGEEPSPRGPADVAPGEASVDEAADEAEREAAQIDAQVERSAFGSVISDLPIGRPPLPVRQYIVDDGERELVARLPARDLLCGKSLGERRAAVASFYRDALRRFRRKGVDDFDLLVAPLTESIDRVEPLARAGRGKVTLTRTGRAEGGC